MRLGFPDAGVAGDPARLVAAEQACCPFFSFALTVDARGVGLEVSAPGGRGCGGGAVRPAMSLGARFRCTGMATYVLIHGAGSDSWYWHLVAPELAAWGHAVVAPDLPADDDSAGLAEYTDVVVEAIGDRRDLIVVAQSMGGFTAPWWPSGCRST